MASKMAPKIEPNCYTHMKFAVSMLVRWALGSYWGTGCGAVFVGAMDVLVPNAVATNCKPTLYIKFRAETVLMGCRRRGLECLGEVVSDN